MTNKFTSTIDVYNKHSAQFVQHFEKKLDTRELDEFLRMVPDKGKILDAGCGSARDSAYFISKEYQAIGIDLSQGLLDEAKKLHPEVPTLLMSLTELSFPNSEFDGIWCKAALLHLDRDDVLGVLKDFYRLLKSEGALFIQTKEGSGESTQPVPFDPTLTRLFTFFSKNELENLVEKAGFEVQQIYDFNGQSRGVNSRDQNWIVILAIKK